MNEKNATDIFHNIMRNRETNVICNQHGIELNVNLCMMSDDSWLSDGEFAYLKIKDSEGTINRYPFKKISQIVPAIIHHFDIVLDAFIEDIVVTAMYADNAEYGIIKWEDKFKYEGSDIDLKSCW